MAAENVGDVADAGDGGEVASERLVGVDVAVVLLEEEDGESGGGRSTGTYTRGGLCMAASVREVWPRRGDDDDDDDDDDGVVVGRALRALSSGGAEQRSILRSFALSLPLCCISLSLSLSLSLSRRRRRCGSVLFWSGAVGVRHLVREGAFEGLSFLGVGVEVCQGVTVLERL